MSVPFTIDLSEAVPARPAATVILARDGANGLEVFFVKRHAEARFMGGAWVFPGGKVDDADASDGVPMSASRDDWAERLREPGLTVRDARALHVAAARECLEEAGVLVGGATDPDQIPLLRGALLERSAPPIAALLRAHGAWLDPDRLVTWARWVTPVGETRRFDARFFVTAVERDTQARHDARETTDSGWYTPSHALAEAGAGRILLVPPTYRTVEELACFADTHALLAAAREMPARRLEPTARMSADESGIEILFPGHPEHPESDPTPPSLHGATGFRFDAEGWHVLGRR